jgi:hypothetical protein
LSYFAGYKEEQIDMLMDNTNPSLALLADWIMAGGNTGLAVELKLNSDSKSQRDK